MSSLKQVKKRKKIIVEVSSESEDEIKLKRSRASNDSDWENRTKKTRNDAKRSYQPFPKSSKESKQSSKRPYNGTLEHAGSSKIDNSNDIDSDECRMPKARSKHYTGNRRPWNIHELLAENEKIDLNSSKNIISLFENDNTIPFICRYRREMIGDHITPEKLRGIKNTYTELVNLRKRAENIISQLKKENILNESINKSMLCAKTNEELEFLYAPYKPASKGSLVERARALGLEKKAEYIIGGDSPQFHLSSIINYSNDNLNSEKKLLESISHIISHNFSKNSEVLEELRRLQNVHKIYIKCSKIKDNFEKKAKVNTSTGKQFSKNDEWKFEHYFNFENDVQFIKPHQVLAINRGEKSKYISVKIIIPDFVRRDLFKCLHTLYMSKGIQYQLRTDVFNKSFDDCYTKKLLPLLQRQIRTDLNNKAKSASIDVFARNLKQLLLMSPLKGERILGIDPGFTNGCKLAFISETAEILETSVIYPHTKNSDPEDCGEKLCKMLIRNKCKVIALGNGTACRETEFWLSKLFEKGILDANKVKYSIVSEQGASIYSCSTVAKKEFPDLDVNLVSAVSIARRLNDPLSEYVKIEPRHIGVGMYQHDINEKALNESLNEIVSECVSFVGVDINTASISVLKHVAGLTEKRAENIIQYRLENGAFQTRKDLLKVKQIGSKTFIQCAGFIRIEPKSLGKEIKNLLDCTWVHPESYDIAKKIISLCNLKLTSIGSSEFIETIKQFCSANSMEEIALKWSVPKERVETVLDALQRQLFQDYRFDFDKKPLFKRGITKLNDIKEGVLLTGAVSNVTHFGAFVDIGVECDGLIHISKMNGVILNIGDRVEVSVLTVDVRRSRIQLKLESHTL